MARYKIIYLLLLTCTLYVSAEEADDRIISLKPLDKLLLQKSAPYQKPEPSFLGKIKNWFFPATDSAPSETRQYLPPQPYQNQADCHPCNQEPWIPIASNVGHNTFINFVPPSSHLEDLRPPNAVYGPPAITHLKPALSVSVPELHPALSTQYGPPELKPSLSTQFGPPPSSQYGPPPSSQYGPPPSSQYGLPPSSQYGPPPSSQYGLPPSSQYGPPLAPEVKPVPFPQYGPPPSPQNQYGPPPSQHLSFKPNPSSQYGPPPQFRQKPGLLGQNLKLPLTTHLKPIHTSYDVPLYMQPPPLSGPYHSLPSALSSNTIQYLSPPPPAPSDSYGAPISTANADFIIKQEYLPPLPPNQPIPLPNLHSGPVLPIHNAQKFRDSISQHNEKYEVYSPSSNVQVLPSVKVADFLASVEHPINVIQSPLVEVAVNSQPEPNEDEYYNYKEAPNKLSENPIVVDDTHTAASAPNLTFQDGNLQTPSYRSEGHDELKSNLIKQLIQQDVQRVNKTFTPPPLDFSNWEPTRSASVQTSMVPPPVGQSTWLKPVVSTTKKPKQIQIIIPYINSKKPVPFGSNVGRMVPAKPYTTLVPVYTPPSSTEEVWSKFVDNYHLAESKKVTATAFSPTTQVYNIRDLLKGTKEYQPTNRLPYDVISLQNNIDDWTQQEYSKLVSRDPKSSTSGKFVPSKQIPDEFFTTLPYSETTTIMFDHEQAGSSKKETKLEDDIETNFIYKDLSTTTEIPTSAPKSSWESASVTVSPLTKEKVYIVTPQPLDPGTTTPLSAWSHPPQILNQNLTKFLVRVDPENDTSRERLKQNSGAVTVVFSEWPHLINNLQTTTTVKPTVKHPLLGLMDLSAYTPPPNSTVETISGHSRVVTVVTPSPVTEKQRNVEVKKKLP